MVKPKDFPTKKSENVYERHLMTNNRPFQHEKHLIMEGLIWHDRLKSSKNCSYLPWYKSSTAIIHRSLAYIPTVKMSTHKYNL